MQGSSGRSEKAEEGIQLMSHAGDLGSISGSEEPKSEND
jgi:hypothetical protein